MNRPEQQAWALMRRVFCKLFCPCGQEPATRWRLRVGLWSIQFTGDFEMILTDTQQVSATISYQDARGNPARVDGAPVWTVDRPDLVALTPMADGMGCDIAALGPLGTAQITVSADADLGEGTRALVALGTVEVIGGEAVAGKIEFGEPRAA